MKTIIIKKLPNFQNSTYDDEIVYVIDNIEYISKTTPFIMDKFRKTKNFNSRIKLLNGKRTGYGWNGNERFELNVPTIEEIINEKNKRIKQNKINYVWDFGNYYQKEQLIDNGFVKTGSESMNINKELIKVANLLRTEHDYGCSKIAMSVGDEIEVNDFRLHLWSGYVTVTDLTNAGKRGKTVERFSIAEHDLSFDDYYNLINILKKCHDYNEAKSFTKGYMNDRNIEKSIIISTYKGIEIYPKGFKKIQIKGKHVYINIDYNGFSIRDLDDANNEPTVIDTDKTGPKQLYRYLSDGNNVNKVKDMSFSDICKLLSELKINNHYYCAMN